jgi:hypothetical protein
MPPIFCVSCQRFLPFKEWERLHRPCFVAARLVRARWN